MIWLILFGLITYFFIAQWVSEITRTPVWLLWVVAMMPVFVLTIWTAVFQGRSMPTPLVVSLFLGCLALYLYLIQRGRIIPPQNSAVETSAIDVSQTPTIESAPEAQSETQIPRPINKVEEGYLQNCFPWSVFYLQQIEYRPQSVVCRGQLRTKPEIAYQTIRENVEAQFSDRFHVVFQESTNREPFFELVTNSAAAVEGKSAPKSKRRIDIAVTLAALALVTTTWAGLQTVGRVPTIPAMLEDGFPYSLPLMLFFSARAIGNYMTARKYGIATTLPYFIPVIPFPFFPLGTIGAFT